MASNDIKFESKDRLPSLFSKVPGDYPVQAKGEAVSQYGGEYRGYYRSKVAGEWIDRWYPKQSEHDGRSTQANNHNGIDIYAAYFPFPRETPILAVTDGLFTPIEDREHPNKIGNRAAIDTKVGGKAVTFRYGHLARFEGRARKVQKGDVIGYAGCSGNADTAGECSERLGCNIDSCHVHFVAAFGATGNRLNDVDPVPLLQWSLDHADTTGWIKCSEWVQQHGRDKPLEKLGETGELIATASVEWRRNKKGKRRVLDYPFEDIEFDSTKAIRKTLAAFKGVESRFGSKALLSGAADEYRASRAQVSQIISDLETEIERFDPIGEEAPAEQPGGAIARAHILARMALWYLMGGSALSWAISNRREGKKSTSFFECGVGVGGEAQLVAVDGGKCALHRSPVKPGKKSYQVWSVTFGAGSMMHATWKRGVASRADPATAVFGVLVELVANAMWRAMTRTLKRAPRLSRPNEPDRNQLLRRTRDELTLVAIWLNSANQLLKEIQNPALEELLKQLAADNIEVFSAADERSVVKETSTPVGPQLSMLRVKSK